MASEGERNRDEAMRRADEHARLEWKIAYDICIEMVCEDHRSGFPLTTDLVDEYMSEHCPDIQTHEGRARGPRMTAAAKKGLIVKTDRFIKSTNPDCNARDKRVWTVA